VVGKTNLPPDAEERSDVQGSATETPGLTPVDQEREASMADEGGAAGATVEREDRDEADAAPSTAGANPPDAGRGRTGSGGPRGAGPDHRRR
jgi:hypothetical protein